MCGRFTLRTPTLVLMEQFGVPDFPAVPPRYNIAPTQDVVAVRGTREGGRSASLLNWGLVPSWSKDPTGGAKMINARAETVAEKPAFRQSFRQRRCLILADGYYEWRGAKPPKQPFYIHRWDHRPFALAGLWDCWKQGEAEPLETCAIITTAANEFTLPIHDRMPVVLDEADSQTWLEAEDPQLLQQLLAPCPSEWLAAEPVDRYVNNPRHEGPACLEGERRLFPDGEPSSGP